MHKNYPAFILHDEDQYTVIFPDLPGCLTVGATVEEAFDNAREALEGHLAARVQERMPIPEPTPMEDALPEAEDADSVAAKVLVPAVLPGNTVRANITIDENLLRLVDSVASNRSAFFADAARNELARRRADGIISSK